VSLKNGRGRRERGRDGGGEDRGTHEMEEKGRSGLSEKIPDTRGQPTLDRGGLCALSDIGEAPLWEWGGGT